MQYRRACRNQRSTTKYVLEQAPSPGREPTNKLLISWLEGHDPKLSHPTYRARPTTYNRPSVQVKHVRCTTISMVASISIKTPGSFRAIRQRGPELSRTLPTGAPSMERIREPTTCQCSWCKKRGPSKRESPSQLMQLFRPSTTGEEMATCLSVHPVPVLPVHLVHLLQEWVQGLAERVSDEAHLHARDANE